jgi:hypothetical protein
MSPVIASGFALMLRLFETVDWRLNTGGGWRLQGDLT